MSNSDNPNVTKAFYGITKWSGKTAFIFLIIALIISVISINLASPQILHYNGTGDQQVVQKFTMESGDDFQIFFASDNTDEVEFTVKLQKIQYIHTDGGVNKTYDFRQSEQDREIYTDIFSITDTGNFRQEYLTEGDYRITVVGPQNAGYTIGTGHFDLVLVSLAVIFWVIFSILASIFFTVLPFTLFILIINSIESGSPKQPDTKPQPQAQQYRSQEEARVSQASSVFKGTPFEKLTRNDWIISMIGIFFLFFFFAEPVPPFLIFAIIAFAAVFYNVNEREKTKDRIAMLLNLYPETSLMFLTEQLDKDKEDIIEVIRIMILDDGYPIRLDLVQEAVTKIGEFPSPLPYSGEKGPIVPRLTHTSSMQIQEEIDEESVEEVDMSETEETEGEIREYEVYCQSCGSGLVKETKYCYNCGARQ